MPRAGESATRLLRLFLFHLLGTWLLLSQLPREIQGQKGEVFIKCNREFVRFFIRVCGTHIWAEEMRRQRKPRSEPSAGESCWCLKVWVFPYNLLFLVRVSPGISPEQGKAVGTVSSEAFGTLHLLATRVTPWGEGRSHRRDNAAQRPIRAGRTGTRPQS